MKKPKRYFVVYLCSWPVDILTWLVVLLVWAFWGENLCWRNGGLWCALKPFSWPARTWYRVKSKGKYIEIPKETQFVYGTWLTWAGTTLGHGGFFGPGFDGEAGTDTPTEEHEDTHVEQFEVAMFVASVIGASSMTTLAAVGHVQTGVVLGLCQWILCPIFATIGGWLIAWLRGEKAYEGSAHEEAAYAIDALKNEEEK